MSFSRLPRHVGFIPDGNRRWARARGLPPGDGYAAGLEPGFRLMQCCRELGIEEVSIYGFTKENVHRPAAQVDAFRKACAKFGRYAIEAGVALLVVGDTRSALFPDELRPFTEQRTEGDIRVNFLVNYGWQWDLHTALKHAQQMENLPFSSTNDVLASRQVSRIELVVRWGGRARLSGFLPLQSAYADFYSLETLWPEMRPEEFLTALDWYQTQDVTMGG
ncbi:MAG: di-trans,poly-cis-decaprenylcistransferase [Ardenticatenales bacterium]|nr:di-trans,poly-cis-decaprenylcistransferase [Ardenticatenales bacterium]